MTHQNGASGERDNVAVVHALLRALKTLITLPLTIIQAIAGTLKRLLTPKKARP